MVVLPRSDHFDSVTCSAIADLDLDGDNEVILGTCGQVCFRMLSTGVIHHSPIRGRN